MAKCSGFLDVQILISAKSPGCPRVIRRPRNLVYDNLAKHVAYVFLNRPVVRRSVRRDCAVFFSPKCILKQKHQKGFGV